MFTLALVRFPPTATKEIQYLNAKGALTYTDIAGDPVLYGNLPPREISMKDVFRSGDSSKKFKIAEGQWYRYAPSYVSPAYHLLEGFPFIQERSEERRVGKEGRPSVPESRHRRGVLRSPRHPGSSREVRPALVVGPERAAASAGQRERRAGPDRTDRAQLREQFRCCDHLDFWLVGKADSVRVRWVEQGCWGCRKTVWSQDSVRRRPRTWRTGFGLQQYRAGADSAPRRVRKLDCSKRPARG